MRFSHASTLSQRSRCSFIDWAMANIVVQRHLGPGSNRLYDTGHFNFRDLEMTPSRSFRVTFLLLSRTVWPQSTIVADDRQHFANIDSWLASHESTASHYNISHHLWHLLHANSLSHETAVLQNSTFRLACLSATRLHPTEPNASSKILLVWCFQTAETVAARLFWPKPESGRQVMFSRQS